MNHIKILNNLEVKTSNGVELKSGVELKLKTLTIDFSNETSIIRTESFLNSNVDSLPIKELNDKFNKLEVSNELLLKSITDLLINQLKETIYNVEFIDEENSIVTKYNVENLITKNTIWHNSDDSRIIRLYVTWQQIALIGEYYPQFLLDVKNNQVPVYSDYSGKWLYFTYLDEPGNTTNEDALKAIGVYIERK